MPFLRVFDNALHADKTKQPDVSKYASTINIQLRKMPPCPGRREYLMLQSASSCTTFGPLASILENQMVGFRKHIDMYPGAQRFEVCLRLPFFLCRLVGAHVKLSNRNIWHTYRIHRWKPHLLLDPFLCNLLLCGLSFFFFPCFRLIGDIFHTRRQLHCIDALRKMFRKKIRQY